MFFTVISSSLIITGFFIFGQSKNINTQPCLNPLKTLSNFMMLKPEGFIDIGIMSIVILPFICLFILFSLSWYIKEKKITYLSIVLLFLIIFTLFFKTL